MRVQRRRGRSRVAQSSGSKRVAARMHGAIEAAPQQEIDGLAPQRRVVGDAVAVAAAHQVAGDLGPVALEGLQGRGDRLAVEAVRGQFGADAERARSRR